MSDKCYNIPDNLVNQFKIEYPSLWEARQTATSEHDQCLYDRRFQEQVKIFTPENNTAYAYNSKVIHDPLPYTGTPKDTKPE
jgi:hypothetical protein